MLVDSNDGDLRNLSGLITEIPTLDTGVGSKHRHLYGSIQLGNTGVASGMYDTRVANWTKSMPFDHVFR